MSHLSGHSGPADRDKQTVLPPCHCGLGVRSKLVYVSLLGPVGAKEKAQAGTCRRVEI